MKKLIGLSVGIFLFSCAAPSNASQPVAGTYAYGADGVSSLGVWDVSGTYNDNGSEILNGGYTIAMDSAGKITGSADVKLSESGVNIDMNVDIKGNAKTTKNITTVLMNWIIKAKGNLYYGGDYYSFTCNGTFKYNLAIDQDTQILSGTLDGRLTVSVKGFGSETVKLSDYNDGEPFEFSTSLPDAMDGSWNLSLQTGTDAKGKPTVQQAIVVLSNGREIVLGGKAAYNAKKDQTTLTLTGSKILGSTGESLKLIGAGADLDIIQCTGKLLGQTLK